MTSRLLLVSATFLSGLILGIGLSTCAPDGVRSRVEAEADDESCEERVSAWREALQEANDAIEETNGAIADAQALAVGDCEQASAALASLEEASTVDEPE